METIVRVTSGGPLARLFTRERHVVELMAESLTNTGIAQRLGLSARSVEAHVRHVLIKLDIADSDENHPGSGRFARDKHAEVAVVLDCY